jgi:hypothetical protein
MFAAFDAGPAPLTADGWHLYSLFPNGNVVPETVPLFDSGNC